MFAVVVLAHSLDGALLIVAVSDSGIDCEVGDVSSATFLNHTLQVVFGVETVESSWWIAEPVDDVGLKSVGVVDHWSHAIFCLQAVGI